MHSTKSTRIDKPMGDIFSQYPLSSNKGLDFDTIDQKFEFVPFVKFLMDFHFQ